MTQPREPLILAVLVNPFAGIGGAVGRKGSARAATPAEARRRGAAAEAGGRQTPAPNAGGDQAGHLRVLTWGGDMGEHSCQAAGLSAEVVGASPSPSDAEHSRQAARALLAAGAQLLLFAGGHGTARDLVDAVGEAIPVLGVPAGCKMHSAVYAINPEAAGRLLADLVQGGLVALHQAEVRDIDEDAFRRGEVRARHYGELQVPAEGRYLQQVKCGGREVEDLVVTEIAASVIDHLEADTYYLVGSGSTVATVMEQLDLPNTLLGVDIVRNEQLVATDVGA